MALENGKKNTSKTPPAFNVEFTREQLVDACNGLLWGIGTSDQNGHSAQVRIRVHPYMIDVMNQILELAPKDWFTAKNRTNHSVNALYNSLLKLGTQVALQLLQDYNEDVEKLKQACRDMNVLAQEERRLELRQLATETQKKMMITAGDPLDKTRRLTKAATQMDEALRSLGGDTNEGS